MKLCLAIAVVVAFVAAQQPAPTCKPPMQWESYEHHLSGESHSFARRKVSYDETNQRVRIVEQYDQENETRQYFDILYLYNEHKYYLYNLGTQACEQRPLNEPFHSRGVPEGATYSGQYYFGAAVDPVNSVYVNSYKGDTQYGYYTGYFTNTSCLPIYHTHYHSDGTLTVSFYFDVTLGFSDPGVFIPPSACL
ncbi:mammalian ependymin-related protein 1-like [Oscarella lobularis]|uniref:mammalian ependymin-related protein 1-like n=1 Tax=Oscarella lobularis TaxID=121494 RepID=UPI00331359DA